MFTILLSVLLLAELSCGVPLNISDAPNISIEELLASMKGQPGMEFLTDPEWANSINMDDLTRIDPDVQEDARLLTVRLIILVFKSVLSVFIR